MKMFTKQEMNDWDENIRKQLVARKAELGFSDATLGKAAFDGVAAMPKGKVQSILTAQGAGENRKGQNIRAADLMNLCEALRLSWYDVMNKARIEVKEARGKE
ncbi:MAG: hypothetical protein PHN64_03325 [Desulfovibrionaceae bacterium]|nr:hypothetical protein [Desulfovibrionaceae bacterium]